LAPGGLAMVVVDDTGRVTFADSEWRRYEALVAAHFTARELVRFKFVVWLVEQKKLQP
jgi:hypothetical protein